MNTKEILKKVKRIEIKTSRIVNSVFSGEYLSSFKGRGMEFDEVRSYYPGDDVRDIDWNVTARMNNAFVKVYKEERELTTMILFDASSSNEFGTYKVMKGEVAAEISSLLSFSAIKNNDKVGLIIFTDKVEKYLPPKQGKDQVLRIIREILYFKTEDKKTDINVALDFLNSVMRKRGIVFLISDMIAEDFTKPLKLTSDKHDLIAIKITDPKEISIPDLGFVEFEDAETGEIIIVDTASSKFRRDYERYNILNDNELQLNFKKLNIDFLDVRVDRPYFDDLVLFFKKRMLKKRR